MVPCTNASRGRQPLPVGVEAPRRRTRGKEERGRTRGKEGHGLDKDMGLGRTHGGTEHGKKRTVGGEGYEKGKNMRRGKAWGGEEHREGMDTRGEERGELRREKTSWCILYKSIYKERRMCPQVLESCARRHQGELQDSSPSRRLYAARI